MSDECRGTGRCHGCASWCDDCGDVLTICDSPTCQRHHCDRCSGLLTTIDHDERRDWWGVCQGCTKMYKLEEVERNMLAAARWGDDALADIYAREMRAIGRQP